MNKDATIPLAATAELSERIARLSPAKRALFELRLKEKDVGNSSKRPIERRRARTSPPLSFAQQRLWFLNQLEPERSNYNQPKAVRLTGFVDEKTLQKALDRVVARHEALRTTFEVIDGFPVQVIAENRSVDLTIVDLRTLSEAARNAETERLLIEAIRRPFDLSKDLMLRAYLMRLGDRENILLLVTHHIASDGWSSGILWREVGKLYEAFLRGEPDPLPELPVQYADYAIWQRQWLQGAVLGAQLSYWRKQLDGISPLHLLTDRPRPPLQSFRGAKQSFVLPESLSEAVRHLSRREGVTLFMALLAAFQTLLHRYTAQNDIVVGSPIAGRTRTEIEGLIGFFVNTLVLRTDFSGSPSFQEILCRVRNVALGAYAHSDVPFEKLVAELHPERTLSHSPFFQVAFALQNTPRQDMELPGLVIDPVEVASQSAKFDLFLSIRDEAKGLRGTFEYTTDLFDDATITRLLGHFKNLLKDIIANPGKRISELSILSEPEKHRLLVDWNNTNKDYSEDSSIHQLFEEQAEKTPDGVAVVFEEQQLTYRELNHRANQLAHYLRALGVGPEVLVGICTERSLEMVVAFLGVLKAGGAYVPLDPSFPEERLSFILQDSQATLLLTQRSVMEKLSTVGISRFEDSHVRSSIFASSVRLACLDTEREAITGQSQENPLKIITPGNLAYVIYTSGSTGQPKGVSVEHRQLLNYLVGILERINHSENVSFATVSTLAADLGNTVVFAALCTGGSLHVLSQDRVYDAEAMAAYMSRHSIDCLKIAPSHLAALQTVPHPQRLLPRKLLVLGGEASQLDWVRELHEQDPELKIINHYGPTEATIGVLTYRVYAVSFSTNLASLPLGRPLANVEIYLLDRYLNPVPIGIPGEIYIGGQNLSRGYLNRPDLTAERFIPNPFSGKAGTRLYQTGDLGRYLADGSVEFLGRADDQVKIRGYRVEPKEIETVLRDHPDVKEAIVLAIENGDRKKQLAAYVVSTLRSAPSIASKPRYRLANGAAVTQLNKNETDYMYQEIFERQAYLRHGITIRDGDCIFDVGANIGLFMLFANQIANNPKVYSFEPNPHVFEVLRVNASLYGPGTKLFDFGLSNEEKNTTFTFFPGFSLLSGFYADPEAEKTIVKTFMINQQRAGVSYMGELLEEADEILRERFVPQTFTAQLKALSDIVAEESIDRIDLLKINVEKSELDVLRGIKDRDWQKIEQIVLEVDVPENLPLITTLLGSYGYEFIVERDRLLEGTQLCYVYAIRPTTDRKLVREQSKRAHIRPIPVLQDSLLSVDELRRFLRQKLPDYLIPSSFVLLDKLPLTPTGKVDRWALPQPDDARSGLSGSYVAPRTSVEKQLAGIWRQVLRINQVGVNDNFFALGGDSILSIQIIARANQLGLRLTPKQLFQYQTVAELANVAQIAPAPEAEQGPVTGEVPLTPIQHWFFEKLPPVPHHWNMAVLLEVRQPSEPRLIAEAIRHLVRHHDALRTRFVPQLSDWKQWIAAVDENELFGTMDLSSLPELEQRQQMERAADNLQGSLNLAAGPLLRGMLFDCGDQRPFRLLIGIHHLVVDGVSWRIILEDLQAIYHQLRSGQSVQLPSKTTSFKTWAERLEKHAQSDAIRQELAYWLALSNNRVAGLLVDFTGGMNSEASSRTISTSFSPEETRVLLHEVPEVYRTQINEILLTALVQAFSRWNGQTGLLIDLEGHGREDIFTDVDLSRTVGWFTTVAPVFLNVGSVSDEETALKSIKEQLRSIPARGIGYGLLRYLSSDMEVRSILEKLPQPEVSFNYLGQFDQVLSESSPFAWVTDSVGTTRNKKGMRRYLLAVSARIIGGQLRLHWAYSEAFHRRATIERLAEYFAASLRSLITRSQSAGSEAFTPTDFPAANLTQKTLDRLIAQLSQTGTRKTT